MSAAHTKEPPCGPAGQASRVRRLLWQTVRWDDGAVYRGLSDAETGHCDAVGAFEYPTGDKYEGTYKVCALARQNDDYTCPHFAPFATASARLRSPTFATDTGAYHPYS